MTIDVAVGPNKQLLEILKAAAKFTTEDELNPSEPTEWVLGEHRVEWSAIFGHGPDRNPNRIVEKTPLISLPALIIDGRVIAVDNLHIYSEAPIEDGQIMPVKSKLYINTRPYKPGASGQFSGRFRIDFDAEGVASFMHAPQKASGLFEFEPEKTNICQFLDGVQQSVDETRQAYEDIGRIVGTD